MRSCFGSNNAFCHLCKPPGSGEVQSKQMGIGWRMLGGSLEGWELLCLFRDLEGLAPREGIS